MKVKGHKIPKKKKFVRVIIFHRSAWKPFPIFKVTLGISPLWRAYIVRDWMACDLACPRSLLCSHTLILCYSDRWYIHEILFKYLWTKVSAIKLKWFSCIKLNVYFRRVSYLINSIDNIKLLEDSTCYVKDNCQ